MIDTKQPTAVIGIPPALNVELRSLCLQQILNEVVYSTSPSTSSSSLADTPPPSPTGNLAIQWIPLELSQEVFDFCIEQTVAEEIDQVLKLFLKEPAKTPLQRLPLQNCRRADVELIQELVKVNLKTLTHIDVRGCPTLPKKFWCLINQAPNLISLKTTKLLIPLRCPSLQVLVVDWKPKKVVQKVQSKVQNLYFDKLLENVLPNLKYLDLSWCPWIRRLKAIKLGKKLETLILKNCDITCILNEVLQLTQLRTLDISVGLESETNQDFNGEYRFPESILEGIVTFMTNLESLDISGTNLISACFPDEKIENGMKGLNSRSGKPFKFLGVYSPIYEICEVEKLPAKKIATGENEETVMEAIKKNHDMPKTLHVQLLKLKELREKPTDSNEILPHLLKMLKTVRLTEYSRYWALKCTYNFLDSLGTSANEVVKPEMRRELLLALNRILHSHMELEKIPEPILCYTFKIFLKLLPSGNKGSCDDGTRREIMRLGKFLMAQNSMAFVYLKTEALLFRLLYQISLEPEVCVYLSENKAVPNCFDFFKTLQIYLGFSLTIRQTTEIVPLVWKSILNFLKASPVANHDFIRNCGLSWMYSHSSLFTSDKPTQTDLSNIFMDIINQLEKYVKESCGSCGEIKQQNACAQELMMKMKTLINQNCYVKE